MFALAVALWLTTASADHYRLFVASWPQWKNYCVKYHLLADQIIARLNMMAMTIGDSAVMLILILLLPPLPEHFVRNFYPVIMHYLWSDSLY